MAPSSRQETFANILLDVAVLRSLQHPRRARPRRVRAGSQGAGPKSKTSSRPTSTAPGITDADTLQGRPGCRQPAHARNPRRPFHVNDLRAACTNAIIAHPMGIIQGVDHLFTGKVKRSLDTHRAAQRY